MKALLVVDEQNDFAEGGALAVQGGKAVAAGTTDFLRSNGADYNLIVATRDWHESDNDNGGHFAEEPNFAGTWPAHCVQGATGADYIAEFDTSAVGAHIVKGMGVPAYSGFEGVVKGTAITLTEVLRASEITEVDVVGIALDYCVKATALDAVKEGFDTTVILDLTAAVASDEASVAKVMEELTSAGVAITVTDESKESLQKYVTTTFGGAS